METSSGQDSLSDRADGFASLRYFMLPVTCGKAIDRLVAKSGNSSSAWVIKLLSECASQQFESPMYCLDITTEADQRFVARQCYFDGVDQFNQFLEYLREVGLFRVVEAGDKLYLTSDIVFESAETLTRKSEAGRKAAKARWGKNKEASENKE